MHKLTGDRMKWGAAALLAGVALGGAALLAVKLRPHPDIVSRDPRAALHCAAPVTLRPRAASPRKPTEHPGPFAVELRHPTSSRTCIRLYRRQTGQTLWTRTVFEAPVIRWSPDRQALAVIGIQSEEDACSFVLLVWRDGERVRSIRRIPPLELWDAANDAIWSPDHRRLLLVGQRGMGAPCPDLWCYRLRDGRTRFIAIDVTQEQWASPSRVRYREISPVFDRKTKSCSDATEMLREWDALDPDPPVPEGFRQHLKQREEVIRLLRAGKLLSTDGAVFRLPARYRQLSGDGEIVRYPESRKTTVVFFSITDGCVDSQLVYVPNGQPPDGPWDIVRRVAPRWFWVSG